MMRFMRLFCPAIGHLDLDVCFQVSPSMVYSHILGAASIMPV